ncbi:MAG TPA: Uma2 family endonuclease, partial [Myxococcaceae bacterium]|nr:Uma2 family endonuclease [Myxococcaceae bacterium]
MIDSNAIVLQQDAYGYRLPYRVRYPVELHVPPGFRPDVAATWPRVDGRLEFVGGRLLYMPPCGDVQQDVAMSVAHVLMRWSQEHPEFVLGGNEAGMILGGETRGADAAAWRKADVGVHTGGFRRVAPVLAVEIAGLDEGEPELRAKARWYLGHGVACVWLVLPETREVIVFGEAGESRCATGSRLPSHP